MGRGYWPDGICDKCGRPVPPSNDRAIIEAVVRGNQWIVFICQSRHFLPVEGCQGSPSAAQYIEGQPRDRRGYPYSEEDERRWRAAYRIVQEHFKDGDPPSPGLIDWVIDLMS